MRVLFDFALIQHQAQLFRVLDLIHEATLSGIPVTKRCVWALFIQGMITLLIIQHRDVFYKDVPLFKNQRIVDTVKKKYCPLSFFFSLVQLVDDIAATFELDRSDLNIVYILVHFTLD